MSAKNCLHLHLPYLLTYRTQSPSPHPPIPENPTFDLQISPARAVGYQFAPAKIFIDSVEAVSGSAAMVQVAHSTAMATIEASGTSCGVVGASWGGDRLVRRSNEGSG